MPIERPSPSELGDREVPLLSEHLVGRRVALLVTGGIAAMKAPLIARALRKRGAHVVAFASDEALRYVTADALAWSTAAPVVSRLSPHAEHLSDDAPFDAYLVAPATYNTINKLWHGVADTPITATLASALGRMDQGRCALLVAPTMHGTMDNPVLRRSLEGLDALGVRVIPPRDAYGKHNIPDEDALVAEVCRAMARRADGSPLAGRRVLVTGGPTPVPVDDVRRLTNKFTGRLGIAIAEELHLRGADVTLLLGAGSAAAPAWLNHHVLPTFDDHLAAVEDVLSAGACFAGVFSAAVADYRPAVAHRGKLKSGGALSRIELVPTEKVIARVRNGYADLQMVTFKYEEGVEHDDLMAIARERIGRGYDCVIANRGEEHGPDGEQVAWLVDSDGADGASRMVSKPVIARRIAEWLQVRAARADDEAAR